MTTSSIFETKYVTPATVRKLPEIGHDGGMQTVVVRNPNESYLYYLAINRSSIHECDVLLPYEAPTQLGTRYVIDVYAQLKPMSRFAVCRDAFCCEDFVKDQQLSLVKSHIAIISNAVHQELLSYAGGRLFKTHHSLDPSEHSKEDHTTMLRPDTDLTERQQKYCSCQLKVEARNPTAKVRVNPFAVCAKSTGGMNKQCGANYDFENMSTPYLLAYARLRNITLGNTKDRDVILNTIHRWKETHG